MKVVLPARNTFRRPARDLLDSMLRESLVALKNQAVAPGYTNIFLKKIYCHLALGRVFGDEVLETGRRQWAQWIAHTRSDGLREYTSPTYSGVTLDSLALIRRHASDETIRREAEGALTLVWSSMAANWFAAAERVSGPHSRDYDYLYGRGYSEEHLADAKWLSAPPATDGAGWLAGAPHAALLVNMPGDRTTPNVIVVFDGRGDPYGRIREPVGYDRHRKWHHLKPFAISSQKGPRVTAAWYVDPDRLIPKEHADRLHAHVVMPADTAIWSEAAVLSDEAQLPKSGVVFLTTGDVAVGLRSVTDVHGHAAPIRVGIHADGGSVPAKRLTFVYADGVPTRPALLALDIEVHADCDDAAFARFRAAFAGRIITATVAESRLRIEGALPLEADLKHLRRIACEPLMDAGTLLQVDGREVGLPLLTDEEKR